MVSCPRSTGSWLVIFVEHRLLYFTDAFVPEETFDVPFGKTRICTPGDDQKDGSTVQFWRTADGGKTWKHSKETSPSGGGDCDVDFLPDGTVVSVDLEITDSYLQESTNWGKTWKRIGTMGQQQDRQWLAHSADGSKIFLVYHDFVAEAEWYAVATYDHKTRKITIPAQDCCHTAQSADQATAPGVATVAVPVAFVTTPPAE